jgi:putative nucleotidyltransferase with HDIG domain
MARQQETRETLPVDRLVKGLYVDLKLSWSEHPFLFSKFKIKSDKDIAAIKQLGLTEVEVIIEYSDVEMPEASSASHPAEESQSSIDALWRRKAERINRASQYRNRRDKVFQRYQEKAMAVRKIAKELRSQPANAVHEADSFIDSLAIDFEHQGDLLTNLVNLSGWEHSFYNHAVNVTILSLMLASAEGLKGDKLRQVGVGALLHDIGKIEIPTQITGKRGRLTHAETEIMRHHPILGRKLAERIKAMPLPVLDIIEQHHEFLDGTGYPRRTLGEDIAYSARLVAVTNTYDALCNPRHPGDALTPKAALAAMYAKYKNKLDTKLVERFIRTIGIYPPGTVVRLNDGSIGLVVTADPKAPLRPEILLYNPDIPKAQALILDLKEYRELSVLEVLPPKEHPSQIYEYLGIEARIGYFIERRPE